MMKMVLRKVCALITAIYLAITFLSLPTVADNEPSVGDYHLPLLPGWHIKVKETLSKTYRGIRHGRKYEFSVPYMKSVSYVKLEAGCKIILDVSVDTFQSEVLTKDVVRGIKLASSAEFITANPSKNPEHAIEKLNSGMQKIRFRGKDGFFDKSASCLNNATGSVEFQDLYFWSGNKLYVVNMNTYGKHIDLKTRAASMLAWRTVIAKMKN